MVSALVVYQVRNKFRRLRMFSIEESSLLSVAKCFVDEEKNNYIFVKDIKKLNYPKTMNFHYVFIMTFSMWACQRN